MPLGTPPSIHWIEEYDYDSDSDLGYFSEDDDAGDGIDLSDEALGDSSKYWYLTASLHRPI